MCAMAMEKGQATAIISEDQRRHVVESVRRWGGPTSDAVLDPACKIFTTPGVEGIVGYRVGGGCAIGYGNPICRVEDMVKLSLAFEEFSKSKGWKTAYVITTDPFTQQVMDIPGRVSMEFGEELYVDPHNDPRDQKGTHGSLVRRKVKHATKEGACVHEYVGSDEELEKAIEEVGISWLQGRKGPQIYISHIHLFEHRFGKRWFYAEKGGRIIGVVVLNHLQARGGWHLNRLMVVPDAPGGTPELLIVSALETIKNEGCHYASFGPVPRKHLGEIRGLGTFSTWVSRNTFFIANKVYRFDRLKTFWDKFHPQSVRTYLLFTEPRIGVKEIFGLARAMNIT